MSVPIIPQRPVRSQQPPATANMDIPRIPPRPGRKDRSVSPGGDRYARSPLNDLGYARPGSMRGGAGGNTLAVPARPPSVDLPSIGQEGNEYAHLSEAEAEALSGSPTHIKAAGDIPMHQPKASHPAHVAKSRVQGVTRTDSDQAAALGIGKPSSQDGGKRHGESRSHSRAGSSGAPSRPASILTHDVEHAQGIPEIGIQVPMYPNAGDVQAPTPSPYDQTHPAGVGFFNNGALPPGRRHERTRSGREIFACPPGSYGLHGHGQVPRDQFENAWYERHPEERLREAQGAYGPAISDGRKEWALSSEDLNRLVRESGNKGTSTGTPKLPIGAPDEFTGYVASQEYASRITSPRPASSGGGVPLHKTRSGSGHHAESPLRKMSFPTNALDPVVKRRSSVDHALESETEDDTIHVEPQSGIRSKYTGGGYDPPVEDLGPRGGNTDAEGGIVDELGYGAPILASDEVAKTPGLEWLQPAVPPEQERRGSNYYAGVDSEGNPEYRSGHLHSRPSSRNKNALHRFSSHASHDEGPHTPLDGVREYEPLFPEDEKEAKKKKALPQRPDVLARHHFPSKDVWEDTPSSLMYETTVETPPAVGAGTRPPGDYFEAPSAEKARQKVIEEDREDFLSEHTKRFAKPRYNKGVQSDMPKRPGMDRRFPSQDVWEDTPSQSLMTTVITPDEEPEVTQASPPDAAKKIPDIPARPVKAQPTVSAKPSRPAQDDAEVKKAAPIIPDRPKPQVPARPSKAADTAPLAKTISVGSAGSAGSSGDADGMVFEKKAPPPRPAKQFGGIKGGFLNELQNKLQLGPQAPKKEAPPPEAAAEEEAAPLADARKGRARGPQRRKPGVSPAAAAPAAAVSFGIVSLGSVFSLGEDGLLEVGSLAPVIAQPSSHVEAATSTVATDTSVPPPAATDGGSEHYFDTAAPETGTKAAALAPEDPPAAAEVPMTEASEAAHDTLASSEGAPAVHDEAVQTGRQNIEAGFEGAEKEKITAFVDAAAQPSAGEENVVVKAQEGEHVALPADVAS